MLHEERPQGRKLCMFKEGYTPMYPKMHASVRRAKERKEKNDQAKD